MVVQRSTAATGYSLGSSTRKTARERRLTKLREKVRQIIQEDIPILNAPTIDSSSYEPQLARALTSIEAYFKRANEIAEATNHLGICINKINSERDLLLPIPKPIVKFRRHRQPRTARNHQQGLKAIQLGKDFLSALENIQNIRDLDNQDWRSLVVLSAMLFDGINDPSVARFLYLKLHNEVNLRAFKPYSGSMLYWIDVEGDQAAGANVRQEKEERQEKQVFIGLVTASLILQRPGAFTGNTSNTPPIDLWSGIRRLLKAMNIRTKLTTLKSFCQSCTAFQESRPGVSVSSALIECITGRQENIGVPHRNWFDIAYRTSYESSSLSFNDTFSRPTSNIPKQEHPKNNDCNISRDFNLLDRVISETKRNNGEKVSPQKLLENLQSIENAKLSPLGKLLYRWYTEEHLIQRKNKATTVFTYHSKIAKIWLSIENEFDWRNGDDEDWLTWYEDLAYSINNNQRSITTLRILNGLHNYGVKVGMLPKISISHLTDSKKKQRYVHARYLTYSSYRTSLHIVQNMPNATPDIRRCLELILIIGYRTGLRISEILKLQIKDVEDSEELHISIRNNRYLDNKSRASLRRLPLAALLSDEEKRIFISWFNKKRMTATGTTGNSDHLLFSHHESPTERWSRKFISHFLGKVLRQASGIPDFRFHSLRHTALSNFHMVLEREWDLLKLIAQVDQRWGEMIYEAIAGSPQVKVTRYWALASLAGHSSPSMTFSSYLHFSHVIAHIKLRRAKISLSRNQLQSITGMRSRDITHSSRGIQDQSYQLSVLVEKRLKRSPLRADRKTTTTNRIGDRPLPSEWITRRDVSILDAYSLLRRYEKGHDIEAIADEFNLPPNLIIEWIDRANELRLIRTREGKSRLINNYRIEQNTRAITPPALSSKVEIADYNRLLKSLHEHYDLNSTYLTYREKIRLELLEAAHSYLARVNTGRPGARFEDPESLIEFLYFAEQKFKMPKERWRLEIKCADIQSLSKNWHQALDNTESEEPFEEIPGRSVVTGILHLKSPTTYNNKYRNSLRTVQHFFHMFAICHRL